MAINDHPAVFTLLQLAGRLATRGDDGGAPIVRNNVGYNGADYPLITAMLAGIDRQNGRVTPRQMHTVANRLEKYSKQAASLGYDLPELLARFRKAFPEDAPAIPGDLGPTSEFTDSVSSHVRQALPEATEGEIRAAITGVLEAAWYQGPPPDSERPPVGIFQVIPEGPTDSAPDLSIDGILGEGGLFADKLPGYQARQPQIDIDARANIADLAEAIAADANELRATLLEVQAIAVRQRETLLVIQGIAATSELAEHIDPDHETIIRADWRLIRQLATDALNAHRQDVLGL